MVSPEGENRYGSSVRDPAFDHEPHKSCLNHVVETSMGRKSSVTLRRMVMQRRAQNIRISHFIMLSDIMLCILSNMMSIQDMELPDVS
jgi:hypothetical protein